jgi:hypothetical protein
MTPEAQAAAEEYESKLMGECEYCGLNKESFLAGCEWTLAHHPKVLKLVEALEKIKREEYYQEYYAEQYEIAEVIAEQALAAFREKETK